ncbi:MAG: VWA domain-containing protein [Firmicutes bacterium]|nr:VWA domain-containing protein [Bacillota bacterium]
MPGWILAILLVASVSAAQRFQLPRAERLDRHVEYRRNRTTGELRTAPPSNTAERRTTEPTRIRAQVSLVVVTTNVLAPDGTPMQGLQAHQFRVFEDGIEQTIEHFDAASMPARIVLLLDISPSIYRELRAVRQAARALVARLAAHDEVALVAFSAETRLLLPFTTDRDQLEQAIDSLELAKGPAARRGSHIYEAAYLAAAALFADAPASGRRAMVLLTDGQDNHLGLSWNPASAAPRSPAHDHLTFEDVCRRLTGAGVEVQVISVLPRPRALTPEWLAAHRASSLISVETRNAGIPHYTAYLAELVRRVGGQLHFLAEAGALADVYRQIADTLRTQYTLGYYPAAGLQKPGWRTLRVEVRDNPEARLTHRAGYYVPASP